MRKRDLIIQLERAQRKIAKLEEQVRMQGELRTVPVCLGEIKPGKWYHAFGLGIDITMLYHDTPGTFRVREHQDNPQEGL